MSNDIVKVRLQYNNKTTSVELDVSRSVESVKPFLRALWEVMEEPPKGANKMITSTEVHGNETRDN